MVQLCQEIYKVSFLKKIIQNGFCNNKIKIISSKHAEYLIVVCIEKIALAQVLSFCHKLMYTQLGGRQKHTDVDYFSIFGYFLWQCECWIFHRFWLSLKNDI